MPHFIEVILSLFNHYQLILLSNRPLLTQINNNNNNNNGCSSFNVNNHNTMGQRWFSNVNLVVFWIVIIPTPELHLLFSPVQKKKTIFTSASDHHHILWDITWPTDHSFTAADTEEKKMVYSQPGSNLRSSTVETWYCVWSLGYFFSQPADWKGC